MLEGDFGPLNLSLLCHTSELPAEFGALGEACGSEWMALRYKPATWIHHISTPISEVTLVDALAGLSLAAQAQSLVGNQLVSGETIMEFDHLHVFG